MDPNLLELIKWAGPPIAAAVASWFACRERIRVLEVKLDAMQTAFDEFKEDMREQLGELRRARTRA